MAKARISVRNCPALVSPPASHTSLKLLENSSTDMSQPSFSYRSDRLSAMQSLLSPLALLFSTIVFNVSSCSRRLCLAAMALRFQKFHLSGMYFKNGNSSKGGFAPGSSTTAPELA